VFTDCGTMHRRSYLPVTLPTAPEDGRNYRPKHVELNEIINILLLLHLVGCLCYCIRDARSHKN